MTDLQQHSWPAAHAGARWPTQPGPRHPLAAGALCIALAVGTWYGLLWRFGQTEEVGATVPPGVAPAKAVDTQPRRETGRVVLAPRTAPSPSPVPAAPRGSPPPSMSKVLSAWASRILGASAPKASTDSALKGSRDSASKPLSTSAARAPSGSAPKTSTDSASKAVRDSAPRPKLSPFRRSHPWAAPAGGQYYYPSSCPATLRLPDLVFFRSEAEARDSGFIPSQLHGCE
jgi:hypothetical protein